MEGIFETCFPQQHAPYRHSIAFPTDYVGRWLCCVVLTAAITSSDYPVVMLYVLIMAVMMLTISFLVDLFTALLDPRVRLEV